ncbi:ABC transporter substrate-binding protein [Aromatoleum diolicum]|uniref:ABC transporter substrate-binding protein n=1 Tax=Aromatoleum diolicum TaxID=75796 RepID=A0ABX1Q742_9RHOO|nr:ABC transporter substrate-binding protein [Aromatoleum diolicum]NMG74184.1 ABC transporter substrate-binding protein [Aromatoleum diolicum]
MLRSLALHLFVALFLMATGRPSLGVELPTIRIGVLQYGTVSWELEAMKRLRLAEREGVRVELVPLALKDASNVALHGGAVDVIVNDWIWVARQRAEGRKFVFVPYSRAIGSVMVRPDSGIRSLADLRGQRMGVAGGALDKSWLLLRAYSRKTVGEDAARFVKPDFGAPPLLNALMLKGELPAVLNFWHFSARLRAAGMRELLSLDQILKGLGVEGELPMVGWVFREDWASRNPALEAFLRASASAKQAMQESDSIWEEIRSLTQAEDDATFAALKQGFRAGIPTTDSVRAERTASSVFRILADEGGAELVGSATALPAGTFWHAGGR